MKTSRMFWREFIQARKDETAKHFLRGWRIVEADSLPCKLQDNLSPVPADSGNVPIPKARAQVATLESPNYLQ